MKITIFSNADKRPHSTIEVHVDDLVVEEDRTYVLRAGKVVPVFKLLNTCARDVWMVGEDSSNNEDWQWLNELARSDREIEERKVLFETMEEIHDHGQ